MFAAVAFAVGLLISGVTVLESILDHREHPVWFILYWFACAWLTVLALLLALFDVLIVRAQARVARKVLGGNSRQCQLRTRQANAPADNRERDD